jgi:hypothetical protein
MKQQSGKSYGDELIRLAVQDRAVMAPGSGGASSTGSRRRRNSRGGLSRPGQAKGSRHCCGSAQMRAAPNLSSDWFDGFHSEVDANKVASLAKMEA